jgi:hypothetical protein
VRRSDAAFLAHLDAIEDRYLSVIRQGFDNIDRRLTLIADDIAGIKIELATHEHRDDS